MILHSPVDIFTSVWFWSALTSWCVAQLTKMLCGFVRTRRLDFHYMVSTGGMPSAHSALVSGLATAIGMTQGFATPMFVLAMGFALVTMFDAATVRRSAGQQATILNAMIDELFTEHRLSETKLKELLGHTRLEVAMGMIVGILTACNVVALMILRDA